LSIDLEPFVEVQPAFSPDGRWMAYMAPPPLEPALPSVPASPMATTRPMCASRENPAGVAQPVRRH